MNIFFTNECPIQSANEHNHVHQTKMIVEYAQLLSTAHRLIDGFMCKVWVKIVSTTKHDDGTCTKIVRCKEIDWYELPSDTFGFRFGRRWLMGKEIYAHTHTNHPSAVWVRKSYDHYVWVWKCAKQLCVLYNGRTAKTHKTEAVLDLLAATPNGISQIGFSNPPVSAPDEFKKIAVFGDTCNAYQLYLCSKFSEWQQRDRPIGVDFDVIPHWYSY
ncbi:hypothetical protein NVP3058O_030 [Vibrio phage 3.058.O._10N.286.46.B8]|nr:hypothetical protein NVP2058O_031 [Vibrio phage 2.058.O._10N.286.46.B8]AUS03100.1 hypothetical protein NVP3058O_030 [Vibrio phage 3.058.O._10N.286.46.B8]